MQTCIIYVYYQFHTDNLARTSLQVKAALSLLTSAFVSNSLLCNLTINIPTHHINLQSHNNDLFFNQLSRFQRLYAKGLTSRLSPYDVSPGYLSILQQLWHQDGVTQKSLKASLDIEQATLSNSLKRMERDGLIRRVPNKQDRRQHRITLTEKGISAQQTVEAAINDLCEVVNKGLTINDRKYFKRIMRQMTEQLESDQDEPLVVLLDEIVD